MSTRNTAGKGTWTAELGDMNEDINKLTTAEKKLTYGSLDMSTKDYKRITKLVNACTYTYRHKQNYSP